MILLVREAYVSTPIRAALLEMVNRRTVSCTNWITRWKFRFPEPTTVLVASIRKPRSTRAVQTVEINKRIRCVKHGKLSDKLNSHATFLTDLTSYWHKNTINKFIDPNKPSQTETVWCRTTDPTCLPLEKKENTGLSRADSMSVCCNTTYFLVQE